MNQLRYEFRTARSFGVTHGSEQVQHRRTHWVGIGVALQVRVEPFSHDKIRNSVAVDVGEGRGVRFGNAAFPGFLADRSSVMMCSVKEIAPLLSRFCSYQASPHP